MPALILLAGVVLAVLSPSEYWAIAVLAQVAVGVLAIRFRALRALWPLPLGFLLATVAVLKVTDWELPCGERLLVTARITSIPRLADDGWQFEALLEFPTAVRLPKLRGQVRGLKRPPVMPQPGERWQLAVTVMTPAQASGGRGALRDGRSVAVRAVTSELNQRLAVAPPSLTGVRADMADRIRAAVKDPAAAALLAALAVGATGDISDAQWRAFSATGISHLVAISGMHVTFFALLCMRLARWLWRFLPTPVLAAVRRESFATVVGVVMAGAYALLSGFEVPAQRTLLMLSVFLLARACDRNTSACWSLGAALIAVLVFDPLAVLDAGFWLSYAAVLTIVLFVGQRVSLAGDWRGGLELQWIITVALLPVTLLFFGLFSLAGLLINPLAIPYFGLLLVPLTLVATLFLMIPVSAAQWVAELLLHIAAELATAIWPLLASVSVSSAGQWFATPHLVWFLAAAAVIGLLLIPLDRWGRWLLAGTFIAPFVMASVPLPGAGDLRVTLLPGGIANVIHVSAGGHDLLFGTGETFASAGRHVRSQILPWLDAEGVQYLDRLVLGRSSADRLAGAAVLLQAGRVDTVYATAAAMPLPPEVQRCRPARWSWGDAIFEHMDWPGEATCALHVRQGKRSALLLLDVGDSTDVALNMWQGPSVDLLVLPATRRLSQAVLGRIVAPGGEVWTRAAGSAQTLSTRFHRSGRVVRRSSTRFGYHAASCGK
jgi:competence protein ComEC